MLFLSGNEYKISARRSYCKMPLGVRSFLAKSILCCTRHRMLFRARSKISRLLFAACHAAHV